MPHVELAFVGLGVGDEFLQVVRRKFLAHRQQLRLLGDEPDRLEIGFRVVAKVRIKRRRGGVRAHVAGDQCVAVRSSARGPKRAGGAAGAADILDYELLAEMPREDIGDDAPRDIGGPARRERHDHGGRT